MDRYATSAVLLLINITLLLGGMLITGCVSYPGADSVVGKFLHKESGTYAVFQEDGRFFYSFTSDSPMLWSNGLPRRLGFYSFEQATDVTPYLSLNSFDTMQFTIRFSEFRDKFYLAYPRLFTGERAYEKVDTK